MASVAINTVCKPSSDCNAVILAAAPVGEVHTVVDVDTLRL